MVEVAAFEFLADPQASFIGLPSSSEVIGFDGIQVARMVYALAVDGYAIRYQGFPSSDNSLIGISFENVLPSNVQIVSGTLSIFTNVAVPVSSADFSTGTVQVQGRIIYASMVGGKTGTDYQLRWAATGSDGSVSTRTALLLCTQVS